MLSAKKGSKLFSSRKDQIVRKKSPREFNYKENIKVLIKTLTVSIYPKII